MTGDVLFNNTNSPELVGKTAFIPKDTNWAYSNHMTRIRLRREIANPAWVATNLHYLFVDGFFKLNCRHHVNQASISSGYLANYVTIPLPPLPEQERIVARLEELLSDLEAGVAALERVRAGVKRYKASVLKAACEGKLFGDTGLKDGELPEGWRWVIVGEVAESMKNGIYKPVEYYVDDGIACLRMYNIEDGAIVWKDIKRMKLTEEEVDTYRLLPGDILVNRVNSRELVGKAAVIPSGLESIVYESKNIRLKINHDIAYSTYINYCFGVYRQRYFNFNAQQVVGMASINQTQIAQMPIPLPPLEEQRRIVAELERRLESARAVDAAVDVGLKRAARLRQAVLRAAFEGRLG
jgi:type I restriction enzyme S subunit